MRGFNISYKCLLLLMLATVLLPSCNVWENDLYVPEEDNGNAYEFIFNMSISVGQTSTRAAHDPQVAGTVEENFIDIDGDDFRIFILDADKNTVVGQFVPTLKQQTAGGYMLSGKYTPPIRSIRVMVMANWQTDSQVDYDSYIKDDSNPTGSIDFNTTTLDDLYNDREHFNFNYTQFSDYSSESSWAPKYGESGIPMFGLSDKIIIPEPDKFLIPEMDIKVNMLRALAKIIVVNSTKEADNFTVASCSLSKYNINGRLIPDGSEGQNPKWNDPDYQVEKPSLPVQTEQRENLPFIASDDYKTFTVYIPEMNVKLYQDKPHIEVVGESENGQQKSYEIQLGKYDEESHKFIEDSYFDAMLRNHRYEYHILSVTNGIKVRFGPDNSIHLDKPEDWDGWYKEESNNNNN